MLRLLRTLLACTLLVAAAGCGSKDKVTNPADPAAAEREALLGDQALANGDNAAANTHYRAALALDANHAHANLGAAVTEVALLEGDSEIQGLINRLPILPFPLRPALAPSRPLLRTPGSARVTGLLGRRDYGTTATGKAVASLLLSAASDPPLLSEVQDVLKRKVLPKLQYAEDRLDRIEQDPGFVLLLVPALTGEPDTLEVDLGEVRLLDSVVNELQGWLGIVVSYNFDVPSPYDLVPPDSLLAPGTAFGTLVTGGAARLGQARGDFLQSYAEFTAGVASIGAETDPQGDDVIPKAALEGAGFAQFEDDFARLNEALNGMVDVVVKDYVGADVTIQVRLGNFFLTPISDWKSKLPLHDFDAVTGEPYPLDPVTFPDPTFNGIFPGMSNDVWRQLIGPVGRPPTPARVAAR